MIENASFSSAAGGVRLDAAVLAAFPSSTRQFVREAVASGGVLVDGRRAPKGRRLRAGETVSVRRLLEASDNLPQPAGECPPPVFEDASLLAFDKPCGMAVQPLTCRETGTLANAVCAAYPECRTVGDAPLCAGAVHRIDAGTSGLVLFARSQEAFDALRSQFAAQTVKKTYLALVEGAVAAGGTLENDLVHDPAFAYCKMEDVRRVRLDAAARAKLRPLHAVTTFAPVGRADCGGEERTLLEVTIRTGVTHQIRAQLALAGIHIVNDRTYGAFAVEGAEGHFLHALAVSFAHPATGDPVEIRTPLPDWARAV